MKTSLSLCLGVVFAGVASVSGQVPVVAPHPHSLSLNVEPVSTGSTTQTSEGTHDQHVNNPIPKGHTEFHTHETETTKESESVQVSVRNFGPMPDTAQVEWYFVAAPANHNTTDEQFIYDKGSKTVTVAPGATETFPVTSSEITSKIKRKDDEHRGKNGKYKAEKSGREKEKGSALDGWMVRVVADGKSLDARASKDQLTDIIKDDAKLNAMKGH